MIIDLFQVLIDGHRQVAQPVVDLLILFTGFQAGIRQLHKDLILGICDTFIQSSQKRADIGNPRIDGFLQMAGIRAFIAGEFFFQDRNLLFQVIQILLDRIQAVPLNCGQILKFFLIIGH